MSAAALLIARTHTNAHAAGFGLPVPPMAMVIRQDVQQHGRHLAERGRAQVSHALLCNTGTRLPAPAAFPAVPVLLWRTQASHAPGRATAAETRQPCRVPCGCLFV